MAPAEVPAADQPGTSSRGSKSSHRLPEDGRGAGCPEAREDTAAAATAVAAAAGEVVTMQSEEEEEEDPFSDRCWRQVVLEGLGPRGEQLVMRLQAELESIQGQSTGRQL